MVVVLAIAILSGLGAAILVGRFIQQPVEKPKKKVLVAQQQIQPFTKLKKEQFVVQEVDEEQAVNLNYIEASDDELNRNLKDRMAKKLIQPKEILKDSDLFRKEDGGLSTVLQQGEVAATIRVTADTAVAGFIQPGFRVDIQATTNRLTPEGNKPYTNVILENVEVLATNTDTTVGDQAARQFDKVTLRLNRDDANLLSAYADSSQSLRLLLRPLNDNKKYRPDGRFASGLGEGGKAASELTPTPVETVVGGGDPGLGKLPPVTPEEPGKGEIAKAPPEVVRDPARNSVVKVVDPAGVKQWTWELPAGSANK
jgi:Flp pilus assembly protein CpaB